MPRRSAADAAETRRRIVRTATDVASKSGFSHVSVREVAREAELSSAGALGPFGSRSDLLNEALDAALASFAASVVTPTQNLTAGTDRLHAIVDRWVDYLTDCPFSGGCIVTAASVDLDGQPGELRERLVVSVCRWRAFLAGEFETAGSSESQALDAAVALMGVAMAVNQEVQLLGERADIGPRARRIMHAVVDG